MGFPYDSAALSELCASVAASEADRRHAAHSCWLCSFTQRGLARGQALFTMRANFTAFLITEEEVAQLKARLKAQDSWTDEIFDKDKSSKRSGFVTYEKYMNRLTAQLRGAIVGLLTWHHKLRRLVIDLREPTFGEPTSPLPDFNAIAPLLKSIVHHWRPVEASRARGRAVGAVQDGGVQVRQETQAAWRFREEEAVELRRR